MSRPSFRALRLIVVVMLTVGCGAATAGSSGSPTPRAAADSTALTPADTGLDARLPPGRGTLRQDDIALRVDATNLQVKAIPLDESIIRTLAPDSYRTLHELAQNERRRIDSLAARTAARGFSLWYVSFFGLAPEAAFAPTDISISSAGRDYRPIEIFPLTTGFGRQRLSQRETQAAIYVFDERLDVNQPMTLSFGSQPANDWSAVLRIITRERALIQSRMRPPPSY